MVNWRHFGNAQRLFFCSPVWGEEQKNTRLHLLGGEGRGEGSTASERTYLQPARGANLRSGGGRGLSSSLVSTVRYLQHFAVCVKQNSLLASLALNLQAGHCLLTSVVPHLLGKSLVNGVALWWQLYEIVIWWTFRSSDVEQNGIEGVAGALPHT